MEINLDQLSDRNPLIDTATEKSKDICNAISDRIIYAHGEGMPYIDYEVELVDGSQNIKGMVTMVLSFTIMQVERAGFTVKKLGDKNILRISGWKGFTVQQLRKADDFIAQHQT